MKKYRGIISTNQVNLYNQVIPTKGLVNEFIRISKPVISHMSHDLTRPIGWGILAGVFFESDFTALIGEILIAEREEEMCKLKSDSLAFKKEHFYTVSDKIKKEINSTIDIEISGNAIYIGGYAGFNGIIDKGIVLRKFPELQKRADEDKCNLIPISELKVLSSGVYIFGELIVFAHRLFRRSGSYLNSLNEEFLNTIENVDIGLSKVKIALDFDVIGLLKSYKRVIELDYWWGPKFSNDLQCIKYGITKHAASQLQKEFFNLKYTELGWHEQDNKHCFECEELLDEDVFPEDALFYMRYVHSLVDPLSKSPIHLDGAVRGYSLNNYLDRIDVENTMDKSVKADEYLKLWCIDCKIDMELWKTLICHYYRDNYLLGEYFGGADDKTDNNHQESEVDTCERKTSSEFLQVMVSIKPKITFINNGDIVIYPFRGRKYEESPSISFIEFEAIHLIKRTFSLTGQISYSDKPFYFISFGADSINFPTIVVNEHDGSITPSDLIILIQDTIKYYQSRNNSIEKIPRIVSFEIAIQIEDEYHVYSCLGDSASILEFVSSNSLSFAQCRSELSKTLMDIHVFLKNMGVGSSHRFAPLRYRRNSCICYSVGGEKHLMQLDCALGRLVTNAICPNCHNDYCDCGCELTQVYDKGDIIVQGNPITIKQQWN